MSVRRQKRTHRGVSREFWIVDVSFRHDDGSESRVRRIPRLQTRRDAEALEREVLRELHDTGRVEETKPAPTFAEFAEEFMSEHAKVNNKPSEIYAKTKLLKNHLVPFLGRLRLDAIDERVIGKYKAEKVSRGYRAPGSGKQNPLKPKSINNQLAVLRTMLNTAVEWKLIPFAPRVKALKTADADFTFLTFDEGRRLKEAALAPWGAMVIVVLNTGIRLGEVLALRWVNVDLKAQTLTVKENDWRGIIGTPKGSKSRTIPLNTEALDALRAHKHLRGPLVFCKENGSRLDHDLCRRALQRVQKAAGIKPIQWHGLRHTFASHLAMRGVPLKAIQELLGHTTIEMTMRYAHLTPDVREAAVRQLDEALQANGFITATRESVA